MTQPAYREPETHQALTSEAEFLALPESNQHIELIDGEVFLAPSPTVNHQELVVRVLLALRAWAATRPAQPTVALSPLDVRFAPGRILQPDVMVFLNALPDDIATPIVVIPDLCIEVVSQNRSYDRITKRTIYAEAAVREYWIVDGATRTVEHRAGPLLQASRVLEAHETLTSALLPGFCFELATLFAKRV